MFTGRRPRAFQFKCCVGRAILGQPPVRCKTFGAFSVQTSVFSVPLWLGGSEKETTEAQITLRLHKEYSLKRNFCLGGA